MTESDTLEIETVGGTQPIWADAPEAGMPVVVVFPALGIEARYYTRLSKALAARGFGSARVDHPGLGDSPVRAKRGVDWSYGDLARHARSAIEAVQARFPDHPTIVLGHSLGGHMALMSGGLDLNLHSTILVASGRNYWRDWGRADGLKIRLLMKFMRRVAKTLGYFPGHKLGFGGVEAKTLICEWSTTSRSGTFHFDSHDYEAEFAKPGPPVLGIALRGDDWVPEASMRGLLAKAREREVTFEWWEDAPHGGNHNRWPSQPDWLVERILRWVQN